MADAKAILVTGARGMGKTTRANELILGQRRVVAFDPVDDFKKRFHWPQASTLERFHALAREQWGHTMQISYNPHGNWPLELHKLSTYLWRAAQPWDRPGVSRKLTLVVDEAHLSVPVTKLPAAQRAFIDKLTLIGRHRGIEVVAITPRPALVSMDFRSAASDAYVFRLNWADDQKLWGRQYAAEIAALPVHHFLHFADGAAARGENRYAASAASARIARKA